MKRIVSIILGLCCLFCCVACSDIPQEATWSTFTKEKAYEIFPKYGQKACEILTEAGFEYTVQNTVEEEGDGHVHIYFRSEFDLGREVLYYSCHYCVKSPKLSAYYLELFYEAESLEEIAIDDRWFEVFYAINEFSTAGQETFKDAEFYKKQFDKVYQKLLDGAPWAGKQYRNEERHVDWIVYDAYVDYDKDKEVYKVELSFRDCLSDDNVENVESENSVN